MKPVELFIDTGGTFTDCILRDIHGNEKNFKVLSNGTLRGTIIERISETKFKIEENWSLKKDIIQGFQFNLLGSDKKSVSVVSYNIDKKILTISDPVTETENHTASGFEISSGEEAPILAARMLTSTSLSENLPAISMKLGSTKGTNALLEKKGGKMLMFVTKGFKDVLHIRYQERPDIFAINVKKPEPLPEKFIEIDERIDCNGTIRQSINTEMLNSIIQDQYNKGYRTAGIALMNSYVNDKHELILKEFLEKHGFKYISVSTELSRIIKYVIRTETTAVNAYLSPVLNKYIEHIEKRIGKDHLHILTSSGSLVKSGDYHPKDSLFSGPAGGVVGAHVCGKAKGIDQIISFDMGGTSTDVSRIDGAYEYKYDLEVGDARIFSPAIAIETVAAGGGSICSFDGHKLTVGPESAGATPGPACYGAGGPLTITDINLIAGRIDTQRFGIPVLSEEAEKKLDNIITQISDKTGKKPDKDALIQGFLQIANEIMAAAIRKISVAKGYNPNLYSLIAFGGAGGMHACAIADLLNIETIVLPNRAGLLSAYGIGQAKIERFTEKLILIPLLGASEKIQTLFNELSTEAIQKVMKEGITERDIFIRLQILFLRFRGQDSSIDVNWGSGTDEALKDFKNKYLSIYGYWPENREIEVESLRVIASARDDKELSSSTKVEKYKPVFSHNIKSLVKGGWVNIPVYIYDELMPGASVKGPALILDSFSTTYVDQTWSFTIDEYHHCVLNKNHYSKYQTSTEKMHLEASLLELFTNRFKAIADQMGAMLQRTSLSVNIKERMDFSCALLDEHGYLVANAPHIPVHLGSLGECVRSLIKHMPINKGDVIITNHPAFGGSHLPDITLVGPVYTDKDELIGYVANRAHHAEIGGITPASMPANASNLAEEGVIIFPEYLVKNNEVNWESIKHILTSATYPTRAINENLADLNAALASIKNGDHLLRELAQNHGNAMLKKYMSLLREYASNRMHETLLDFGEKKLFAQEYLDDGNKLCASININNGYCTIDFSGTSDVHHGNLNATTAIVNSVVIYVLRLLINKDIPLNDGLFGPIKLIIPYSLLNPDFNKEPEKCPSIVGGNVEVSQRLTDTLLKAFEIMACSQGTMNNVMFGNDNFSYYETICGGCGAGDGFNGASAVHHHMTNTRITDPEIMEYRYPVLLNLFEIRDDSGGEGQYNGGNGVIRKISFLEKVTVSLLSQHRLVAPYGLSGGEKGGTGDQYLLKNNGRKIQLKEIDETEAENGDTLVIKTPGGGGYGNPKKQ